MKTIFCIVTGLLTTIILQAQNVGIGTLTPHPSAKLEVQANDKGVLVPRLSSAQRTSIPSPAQGLLVFDNDTGSFWFFNGVSWVNITTAPFALPYTDEANSVVPAFSIKNNGPGAGIRGFGTSGPGLYAITNGSGLAGTAIKAENTNASGIGLWSFTSSADANMVISNSGTGDLLRGFSGPSAGNLVYRILNNGTLTTTGNIGIGTSGVPSSRLEVNGSVKIVDGTQGSNKVLTSDGSGNASWQSLPANPASTTFFHAEKTGNAATHEFYGVYTSNHTELITYPAEYSDAGDNYNSTTSTYTIPQSGYYFFLASATFELFGNDHVWLELHRNGSAIAFAQFNVDNSSTGRNTLSLSHSGFFSAGALINVKAYLPSTSSAVRQDARFSGWRVY